MTQYRNVSDDTYTDALTGQSAVPDGVINVPDDYAEFFVDHPVWREVGAAAPVTVAPLAPPVDSVVETDNTQEVV